MYNITLISTVHKEFGNCNSNELLKIIENIGPDVIFLEAFEDNYSKYDQMIFSQFGVYKERLELKTIQKYSQNHTFEYVPVLDIRLSDEFETKTKIISENKDCQKLLDEYSLLEMDGGFQFLNSEKSIVLQEEMRELENRIVDNEIMRQKVNANLGAYENSMLRNIYSFCKEKSFNTAIFMCGSAHRKSISEKIEEYKKKETIKLNWTFYNDKN
ncbi:MAG: hypothetical protein DRI86_05300 [Bacteroidetes bacterium]|nr:MAG: hypothetical protein DRI86_05300 [Bacteroidota bacterium]